MRPSMSIWFIVYNKKSLCKSIIYGNFYAGTMSPCGRFFIFAVPTNKGKTNPSGLAFFCLLPRVCAGSCGFLRTTER